MAISLYMELKRQDDASATLLPLVTTILPQIILDIAVERNGPENL